MNKFDVKEPRLQKIYVCVTLGALRFPKKRASVPFVTSDFITSFCD